MKLLVSAGPTREAIDPVRFLSNHSSGKMGYAIAQAALERGWNVTLVSGPVSLTPPDGLAAFLPVVSAAEMADAVKKIFPAMDAAILCAAVADYRPAGFSPEKIKKAEDGSGLTLHLERTEDILLSLGKSKRMDQLLIGFAAETGNVCKNAREKLSRKNLNWIAANRVGLPDRGFQADENALTLIPASGPEITLPLMGKLELARKMLTVIFPG